MIRNVLALFSASIFFIVGLAAQVVAHSGDSVVTWPGGTHYVSPSSIQTAPNYYHQTPVSVPSPSSYHKAGWLNENDLRLLFSGNRIKATLLDGRSYGSITAQPNGQVYWQPSGNAANARHGTWTSNGNNACFNYTSGGIYCYLYYSDGAGRIYGYHDGRPNHVLVSSTPLQRQPLKEPEINPGQCHYSEQSYCGPSICNGSFCTRDYHCRCEPGGLPEWQR
jgi:hypothetical protein